ncbi:nucleotide pyrophosphohydrolase [Roseburia hominis]
MKSIEELQEKITAFRDERNWKQFHNPKDLAISISLEAAELLEIFQWSGADLEAADKKEKIEEELADVMIYCGLMADAVGLDIDEMILKKLKRNNEKYPVDKAYGSNAKYTELEMKK